MKTVVVGIIGGTGYTGMELLRLFNQHPAAHVQCITSRAEVGKNVSELFPALRGKADLKFSDPEQAGLRNCDVVFCAAPNGVAMTHAPDLLQSGVKVIDLSADFRLQDIPSWESWYGMTHACPDLVREAVYGLPEIHREQIRTARLVANPGCYPTTVQVGFFPLLAEGLIEVDSLIADAKSGVSGAGRKASVGTLYSEISESFKAYAASGHRHLPEIRQGLENASGKAVDILFTPHLVPMIRGIHATLYCRLKEEYAGRTLEDIQQVFENRYSEEPFVDVMPSGSHPDTRSVRGSNMCRIALHRPGDGRNLVILVVEDNLVKGAAGQAIQNMNIMFGLDESAGLDGIALVP